MTMTLAPVSGPSELQIALTDANNRADFYRRKYVAVTMMVSIAADHGACSEFASGILDNVDYVTRLAEHAKLDLTDQLADIIAYVSVSDEVSDYLDWSVYRIVEEISHKIADQIGVSRTKVTNRVRHHVDGYRHDESINDALCDEHGATHMKQHFDSLHCADDEIRNYAEWLIGNGDIQIQMEHAGYRFSECGDFVYAP